MNTKLYTTTKMDPRPRPTQIVIPKEGGNITSIQFHFTKMKFGDEIWEINYDFMHKRSHNYN